MKSEQFYIGKKVKIKSNTCCHAISLGEIVVIESVEKIGEYYRLSANGWLFDQDDCSSLYEYLCDKSTIKITLLNRR